MIVWFKDNALALLMVCMAGVGSYTLSVSRISVLEVKVAQQEARSGKTDQIIENNTKALTKIAVLFAKLDGKLENFEYRMNRLEDDQE